MIKEERSIIYLQSREDDILFAIVDGLEQPDLVGHARGRAGLYSSSGLYTGQLGSDYELHMPRLVRVDAELLEWLKPIIQADIAGDYLY